ncbi:MAG TPA: hypothetical protein VIH63_15745 [Xanthobacteraceae bacterium]
MAADGVFLLIEYLLLAFGDMAAIDLGHVALLLANRVIFPVTVVGLLFRDLAFFQFTVDPAVLVCKPVIDLIAARVIALPLGLSKSSRYRAADESERNNECNSLG